MTLVESREHLPATVSTHPSASALTSAFERVRATAFYDYLIKSNLKVNTIVGGHGVVGSFNDLKKAVSRPD